MNVENTEIMNAKRIIKFDMANIKKRIIDTFEKPFTNKLEEASIIKYEENINKFEKTIITNNDTEKSYLCREQFNYNDDAPSSILVRSQLKDKGNFLIVHNPPFMYDSTQWNLGQLSAYAAMKEAISVANIIGTVPVLRLVPILPKEKETLNISLALVVLSSCDSARRQVKAEGVTGMARAFLSAGAPSSLVSLWRVPDKSVNIFMQLFYRFLVNGLPSLEALQRSMQCLRCFLKYSHYVHWSEFQITRKKDTIHKNSDNEHNDAHSSMEKNYFRVHNSYDSTQWNLGLLPYAEKEAISVANIIGTVPVLREQATKRVMYQLRSAKVIHLATHGSAFAGFLSFLPSFPESKPGLVGDDYDHVLKFPKKIKTLNTVMTSSLVITFHSNTIFQFFNHSKQFPLQSILTVSSCSDSNVNEMMLQGKVLFQRIESTVRGFGDKRDSSSSNDNNTSDSPPEREVLVLTNASSEINLFVRPVINNPYIRPPIPLNLPETSGVRSNRTVLGTVSNTRINFLDPDSIISAAAVYLYAGDYGTMIKVLEILNQHLVLPEDIDMAKEFGLGLANYNSLQKMEAKPCFNALFEKSSNYGSSGNQALASIYLGEIEMSQEKYKDAEKHFTLAMTCYSSNNVAEKFQQIILTKSAVLVKKGQCHRSLSQIREAISAFKMAKEIAELAQGQTRGSKLKTAKEDELNALCALGNILQSIGDYEQSFEYYEKSLKLASELGDHVSVGWAHGNLGNAMLGLDQKVKALDHLIMAFHMSARYEGNPLAVGKAVSNLGNAYQAIGNLQKAKEYYEIALGHAIYGNDMQGQGRACGNIGNVYMLLKEPVKAVHYYTETLRLSTDRNTKITGYHNRGCATYDVAECILQGKRPKELVTATTSDSAYGTLTIKLTDEVITTDPVQETKPNREPSSQSVSEQRESSMAIETLPIKVYRLNKFDDQVANVRLAEALPFLEAAKNDLLQAIESHEQSVQNVKGSHDALSLSLSLFEINSRSFYKMQETLVELGKLHQQLSELDMVAAELQEFKEALVYGEQARARTLGELVLQKKKTMYSDLSSISTPLKIQDIYKAVELQKVPVVFISYCITKVLMWILVSVEGEVIMKCQSIDLKEEELEYSSFELYIRYNLLQFLSKDEIYIFRQCAYEQESPFTVLHDVIGVKIIEELKSVGFSEVTEVIVIPDSVTHLLPFCPLMNKENWQFFGDKYRIRIVPSFLSLLVMSTTGNPVVEVPGDKSDFLIVGNPTIPPFMYDSTQWNLGRLPHAEKEAISVANIIGTVPVLREQATKQSILYRLRSAKVIHLATHGSASAMFLAFTSSFPVSKSGLAEKEHILIFPKEIETLNISPALVVLSSCDSARGQVKAEGVIGMARAFLSAGAHSVLVSLWRVPDESANIFMQFFYQFLVNGLPSLEALQRSMQCLRCFLKYSHYVHWSGFQIIGKEVTFHKDPHAHFPIQKMLGEVSIFPRQQHVKSIEESLLGVKIKIFTDVQLLVGTPGNEPEECARDFIKNCYYYYPCGVYWYDASDELLLETNMKVAHETPLVGGVYKEQKELDVYPTITNPSLLTTKNSKPTSRKDKKLIVLNNFTNLEKYSYIMREMKDASTDIIVVSNELFCKDEIAKDFDKYFSRGCNIIEVTSLEPISIMQRIVYALLEKNSFVARDADHIVFTLLSEYSRGAATIVHLLTSLMQKNEDNSRTGFELVKRQLKLHIAHQKLERFLNSYDIEDALSSDFNENSATERESHKAHESAMPRGLDHPGKSLIPEVMSYNKKHADVSGSEMHETSCSDHESPKVTDNDASLYIKNEACLIMPDAHSIECGSMQTIAKDSEVTHGDEVIGIALEALKPSTSEQGNIQMIAKDSEIAHGDDVIGITLEALRPLTSERSSTQTIAKDSEIVHGDDILKAPKPLSTGKHSSTQTKVKGSGIGHGGDVISITQEAYQLPSQTGELSSVQTEIDDSEIAHDDDVIGITTEAYRIPSSTSKHSSTQTKVKGSKNDKQTTTSDTTQPLATAKLGKSNVTAVQRHPLYMYINNILSTTSNISLPAHHLLNCLTITGPIPLPLFYVEALDNIVLNAVFSKEKKRIQAESPLKQLMKEGVIRNSCYPILYHRDLDSGSINSSIKPMFIPSLICNAVKDEMDDTDKALSILSAQSALKSLLTNEPKPSVTHLHYLLIVCNQLHDVCSQELHEFNQLLTDNLNLKLHISLTLSSKHDYRANLSS